MLKITLKAARVNAGLKQKEAAKLLGISNKTLCAWESGRTFPKITYLGALCDLYAISYDHLSFLPDDSL